MGKQTKFNRLQKLTTLQGYFLAYLVEDAQDGTPFDCMVLDKILEMQNWVKDQ